MQNEKTNSKFNKMLRAQQAQAWDLQTDIDWSQADFERPLLPMAPELVEALDLSEHEATVLSQFVGLMAIQAIAQHEHALQLVRRDCWERPAAKQGLAPDVVELGEQFFDEESKHSEMFSRYVAAFAYHHNIRLTDLLTVLPRYDEGLACRLFRLNSRLGGRAVWWLVMLTEEESLDLFRSLRPVKNQVDPLFYQIHQKHFEEEVRHISYAPLMLRKLGGKLISRFDYIFAEVMHVSWLLAQLRRLYRVRKLKRQHPMFATMAGILTKFERRSLRSRWRMIFADIPFLSPLFRPTRHKAIRIELRRNQDMSSFLANCFSVQEA